MLDRRRLRDETELVRAGLAKKKPAPKPKSEFEKFMEMLKKARAEQNKKDEPKKEEPAPEKKEPEEKAWGVPPTASPAPNRPSTVVMRL